MAESHEGQHNATQEMQDTVEITRSLHSIEYHLFQVHDRIETLLKREGIPMRMTENGRRALDCNCATLSLVRDM